ncbi:MAG: hypothetical protein FNT29_10440 [Halothiobacillaceae bacterium]|nr:MAG: hypothetical protein FNT29_10440 [Halothiobacillaceae bacterium]
MDIDDKVAALRRPDTYPEPTAVIEVVETHMSWVFMTERHVYKLKKPVRHAFLDFSTLAARERDCLEELRLNRRLAPDVYLDVVPLRCGHDGVVRVEGEGRVLDWLVKMRRLPGERMLKSMIMAGEVREDDVRRFMAVLCPFYRQALAEPLTPEAYLERYRADIDTNGQALLTATPPLPPERITQVLRAQRDFLVMHGTLLAARVAEGRIIGAHGDLRPEHICLLPQPVFIDGLEFKRDFRLLDPVEELAFLAMECEHLKAAWIGGIVFDSYRQCTGDHPPQRLISFYLSFRAALRARLAVWHARDGRPADEATWLQRAGEYLAIAARHAEAL